MHTYQRAPDAEDGTPRWQAGILSDGPTAEQILKPLGPAWEKEEEAASFASYMNGGRWSPGELAGILPPPDPPARIAEEAVREERRAAEKANRPKGMDYPPAEDANKPKAKAHASKRKHEVKRSRKHK